MKTLYQYFLIFLFDLFLLYIFGSMMISSFLDNNLLYLTISSIIVAMDLNEMIDRHRNFRLYYPHFEDKWLKM